jgi:hypothetical protein
MQRIGLLPREVQAKILAWAMEPTPSATLVKASIGDRYGHPGWWATEVGRDQGYQRFLNYHMPCLRLWARALEVLHDSSLAWKWSQTSVFLNKSGNAHVRGAWEDLENEMAIRRNIRRKPPVDKFLHEGVLETHSNQLVRGLYMNMQPDDMPPLFRCTHNRMVLADLKSYGFWLEWSGAEIAQCIFLYRLVEIDGRFFDRIMRCPPVASRGSCKVEQF